MLFSDVVELMCQGHCQRTPRYATRLTVHSVWRQAQLLFKQVSLLLVVILCFRFCIRMPCLSVVLSSRTQLWWARRTHIVWEFGERDLVF